MAAAATLELNCQTAAAKGNCRAYTRLIHDRFTTCRCVSVQTSDLVNAAAMAQLAAAEEAEEEARAALGQQVAAFEAAQADRAATAQRMQDLQVGFVGAVK